MNPPIRIDSYALARPDGAEWRTEWCSARQDEDGAWRFGEGAGELLRPVGDDRESNEYLEAPEPKASRGPSSSDLAYFQLRGFLSEGAGPLDLLVGAGIERARLESLLGVLEALGYEPRGAIPTALLAARDLSPGRYGIIELGRGRSWVSVVDVQDDQARLEEVREYGNFGFYHLFVQWMESVAEAFAARHRFDMHRNLAANRERLFGQMRRAFSGGYERMRLSLDSRVVTLDQNVFQARWPKPALDTEGLRLLLLPPLARALPLPERGLGFPLRENPAPDACLDLGASLPEDGRSRRCVALSI